MKSRILGLLAVGLLAGPMAAHAVLVNYGTGERLTVRNCAVAGASGCDQVGPISVSVYGGLPGDATSSATLSMPGVGAAAGTASLSGTIGAPVLKASASSDLGKRTNANVVALQTYTYTGAAAATRTFSGALTYSQDMTGDFSSVGGGGTYAVINVFTLPGSTIDVGNTAQSNFDALFSPFFLPGYVDLGFDEYFGEVTTAAGSAMLEVTVTLNPGDTVWAWALLQTPAPNGSSVDASNTLITSWDNPAGLTPAVSVPEPGSLALLGLGLAGLAATRRRKQ